jgi:hypothetical protein
MLELRAVRGCMAESLAQLATWILPSVALPIALPATVTVGGVREAAEIRSRCNKPMPSVVELVGTPYSMKIASATAKISRRLAVRNEGYRRGVRRGQQRCIDDNRPHG